MAREGNLRQRSPCELPPPSAQGKDRWPEQVPANGAGRLSPRNSPERFGSYRCRRSPSPPADRRRGSCEPPNRPNLPADYPAQTKTDPTWASLKTKVFLKSE